MEVKYRKLSSIYNVVKWQRIEPYANLKCHDEFSVPFVGLKISNS